MDHAIFFVGDDQATLFTSTEKKTPYFAVMLTHFTLNKPDSGTVACQQHHDLQATESEYMKKDVLYKDV